MFHVSLLEKCVPDPNQIIVWDLIRVEPEGYIPMLLVCIIDRKFTFLSNMDIMKVKFYWTDYIPQEATRELEDTMWKVYMQLF